MAFVEKARSTAQILKMLQGIYHAFADRKAKEKQDADAERLLELEAENARLRCAIAAYEAE